MGDSMKLKDLKLDQRPRERLIENGPKALSDIELLAILLGSGSKKQDVFALAQNICANYSFYELKQVSYQKLIELSGIKKAKACLLLACFELARRSYLMLDSAPCLDCAAKIHQYILADFMFLDSEQVVAVYLNCKLKPVQKFSSTTLESMEVGVPIRQIVVEALRVNAYGLVLIHNHPSGDLKPSFADIKTTKEIEMLLFKLNILFLDHLIVYKHSYYSFLEHGILNKELEYNDLGDSR